MSPGKSSGLARTLVLTGRTAVDEQRSGEVESLRHSGCTVVYRALDVRAAAAVRELIADIETRFGRLSFLGDLTLEGRCRVIE